MTKPKVRTQQQLDHHADIHNAKRGTDGTNITYAKVHGNRGKQMQPTPPSGGKGAAKATRGARGRR